MAAIELKMIALLRKRKTRKNNFAKNRQSNKLRHNEKKIMLVSC